MPDARVLTLLRHRLAPPPADGLPDAELLARFLDRRDEAAFEALVRRHGPMVRAVCRAALPNPADADDAFQATFLVLVRRADAIRDRAALGGWLYRVAYRVAGRLRRSGRAAPLPDDVPDRVNGSAEVAELRRVVADEVARLPEKYRLVVQLCYVVGRTTADAAASLGWAKGTVLTRLAWARRRLRTQLERRGVAVAVGSIGLLVGKTADAVGPEAVSAAVRAAVAAAGGDVLTGLVSDRTLTLTEGAVRAMTLNKLKWVAGALLLAAALAGIGVGRWTASTATADPGDGRRKPIAAEPDAPPAKAEPVAAGEGKPGPAAVPADDPGKPGKPREFVVSRPVGTWVREIGGVGRVTVRFDEDRLYGTGEITTDGKRFTLGIEADYSFNKESVVYGVITAVDCDVPDEAIEMEVLLVGQPFAFRFRADEGSLTIKDPKGFGLGLKGGNGHNGDLGEVGLLICGRYAAADQARPAPRPAVKPGVRSRGRSSAPAATDDFRATQPALVGPPGVPSALPAGPALPPAR